MEAYLNSQDSDGTLVYIIDGPVDEQVGGELQLLKQRPKKPRALVYQFFDWSGEDSRYACKICGKKYSIPKSGGTGSLNNHMIRDHQSVYDNAKQLKTGNVPDTSASSAGSGSAENVQQPFVVEKITSEVFCHKLIKFIVCCDEPFTLTENEYFRDLIHYVSGANDDCKLFCAKTTKERITELFDKYKSDMKAELQKNDGKISFVIDCWTSSNQHPFQGVIARWINNDWELCSTVLDLTILKGSHEGKNIAAAFWDVVKDYNLIAKVLGVTTDNASNMDTMFDELEKLFNEAGIVFESKNQRLRCFAHIMNLSCQEMIRSVGDGDKTQYASDEESDTEDERTKTKVLPVVAKMRKGVVAIRNSPQRREALARQCVAAEIEPRVVLRDVRTRWNATHTMMKRANDLKQPFDLTLRSIPKLRKYVLDEQEWEKIDELLELLAPFKEATEMLSTEQSPTVSRVATVYQALFDHLQQYKKTDCELSEPSSKRTKRATSHTSIKPIWLTEAAERGLEKLEKYYPSTDGLVYIVNTGQRASIESLMANNSTAREGRRIRIVCKVRGQPPPKVTWFKDGRSIGRNRARYQFVHLRKRSELIVKSAFRNDSGLYECRAKNKLARQPVSRSIRIEVLPKEYDVTRPPNNWEHSGSACPVIGNAFCLNGGTCVFFKDVGEPACRCPDGFLGNRCETKNPTNLQPSTYTKNEQQQCGDNKFYGSYYC